MPLVLPVLHASIEALCCMRKVPARTAAAGASPTDWPGSGVLTAPGYLAEASAAPCARLIGKARWRARLRLHDARLEALVLQAGERLDDLDETLLRCHPVRDLAWFAEAARLHRELARVQASRSAFRRKRRASRSSVGTPAASVACGADRPRRR